MKLRNVLGVDCGMEWLGWAVAPVFEGAGLTRPPLPAAMGVSRTKPSREGKAMYGARLDYQRRITEHTRVFEALLDAHSPALVVAEAPSSVRSSEVMLEMGMVFGMVYGLAERRGIPLVQLTPQSVRATLGLAKATKKEVQKALDARSGVPLGQTHLMHLAAGQWEHPYDAYGVVVASTVHPVVRAMIGGVV